MSGGESQIGELWIIGAALLSAGVLSGFVAGLLGVGGGIVVVAVLYQAFAWLGVDESVRMHLAVGTSLAIMVPTSLISLVSHNRRDAVDWELLKLWAPAMAVGAVAGSLLTSVSDHIVLTSVFASFAGVLAVNMLWARQESPTRTIPPKGIVKDLLAGSIGGLSAMMGIGGGTFGVTAMTLFGYPIHRAIATAAGFGLMISVPATIALVVGSSNVPGLPAFSLGYVNYLAFALLFPSAALSAPLGASAAHKLNRNLLVRIFGVFLALTSFRMFWDLLG